MSTAQILLYVILIVLVFYALSKLFSGQKNLTDFTSADNSTTIDSSKLASNVALSSYTYSIWIYVKDWNLRYGYKKIIFERIGNIQMYLGKTENDIHANIAKGAEGSEVGESNGFDSDSTRAPNVSIRNIPLQRWVHVMVSVEDKAVDMYLNGKLVKTTMISGPINQEYNNNPIHLFPTDATTTGGDTAGFSGYVSNFKFWPDPINPQEAWNVYRKGPGGDFLGQLFNTYKLQFNFLKDDKAQFSFST